jgi:2-polyprenyl-3-methyl-5-hydroxy-6-metoxy-1,4-benzoquinol methylase
LKVALERTISESILGLGGVFEAVTLRNRDSGKTYSFVVVDDAQMIDQSAVAEQEKKSEKIWELVWDKTYSNTNLEAQEDDFASWVSAYDNKPIPLAEMIECRDNAVGRIKQLNPRSLMEVGFGTGLLLWKLHDVVETYFGIDPSEQAIEKMTHALNTRGIKNASVVRGTATFTEQGSHPSFDTVVMNSVIQYFPGTEYLRSVIESMLRRGCDSLFLGDLKSLRHRSAFQLSVALHRAIGSEPAQSFSKRKDSVQANELAVSEEFLEILAGDAYVLELQLKQEGYFNEMSRYRYDAIFHRTKRANILVPEISSEFTSMVDVEALIGSHPSSSIEILNIPNSRLVADVWAFENVSKFNGTVQELLKLAAAKRSGAVDPGDLYTLGERHSLNTRVVFSRGNLSLINALFEPKSAGTRNWVPEKGMSHPFFTNDPIGKASRRNIARHLKDQLVRLNGPAIPDEVIPIHQLPRRGGSLDIVQLIDLIPDA